MKNQETYLRKSIRGVAFLMIPVAGTGLGFALLAMPYHGNIGIEIAGAVFLIAFNLPGVIAAFAAFAHDHQVQSAVWMSIVLIAPTTLFWATIGWNFSSIRKRYTGLWPTKGSQQTNVTSYHRRMGSEERI